MSGIILPNDDDQKMVENALPGFMFALLFNSLRSNGHMVRADLEELANKCSAAALMKAQGTHQSHLAGIVEKHGYEVLKNAGADGSLPLLIGGLSQCLVKMQDDGREVNKDALIIALSIVAEIDDDVEDWGTRKQINRVMVKIDNELVRAGYFKAKELVIL